MRDLAGFVILVLVLLATIYLIGNLVVPLLFQYAFGVVGFFVVATVLVYKGRRHPSHLESLLKPGVAPVLLALAVLLPLMHSLVVWLLGVADEWWVLFIINATFPVMWTARLLLAHTRQKALYVIEGHDIEDLLDLARQREAALEVLDDALASATDTSPDLEAWEREVGLGPLVRPEDPQAICGVRDRIAEMRERYRALAESLNEALVEVRARAAGGEPRAPVPHPKAARDGDALAMLEGPFNDLRRQASRLLSEVPSGSRIPGWDEEQ